jgi:hypothetical protein
MTVEITNPKVEAMIKEHLKLGKFATLRTLYGSPSSRHVRFELSLVHDAGQCQEKTKPWRIGVRAVNTAAWHTEHQKNTPSSAPNSPTRWRFLPSRLVTAPSTKEE